MDWSYFWLTVIMWAFGFACGWHIRGDDQKGAPTHGR